MSTSFNNITDVEVVSSELHFTNASDYQRVASTEASQPSIMQLNESHLSLSLPISSSGSPSQKSILHIITITSSGESQSQPDTSNKSAIKSSHSVSMTAEHEDILRKTVEKKTHLFTEHTNFVTLLPYLYEKKLVHTGECEKLEKLPSHQEKGNHFYTIILPRKGKHAYRQLYRCLKKETKHLGHKDLVEILNKALRGEQSPQSSSDSSPTTENNSDHADAENFHELCDSSNRVYPLSTVKTDIKSSSSNDTLISDRHHCRSCKCGDGSQTHVTSCPHPPLCTHRSDDGDEGKSDLTLKETPQSIRTVASRNRQTNGCCTIL